MTRSGIDNPQSIYLSRGDFLKAVGVVTGVALLEACLPTKLVQAPELDPGVDKQVIPTLTLVPKETKVPKETEQNFPSAELVDYDTPEFEKAVDSFRSGIVSWYDGEGKLQSEVGDKSIFTMVGGFSVNAGKGVVLPTGRFGVVTEDGGEVRLANKLIDGSWVVLQRDDLKRNADGHVFESYGYPANGVFWPILSVEKDESGKQTGNTFYLDRQTNKYYKLTNPMQGEGVGKVQALVTAWSPHLIEGQRLMQNTEFATSWNFHWNDQGELQIVNGDTVLYDHWDASKREWVASGVEDGEELPAGLVIPEGVVALNSNERMEQGLDPKGFALEVNGEYNGHKTDFILGVSESMKERLGGVGVMFDESKAVNGPGTVQGNIAKAIELIRWENYLTYSDQSPSTYSFEQYQTDRDAGKDVGFDIMVRNPDTGEEYIKHVSPDTNIVVESHDGYDGISPQFSFKDSFGFSFTVFYEGDTIKIVRVNLDYRKFSVDGTKWHTPQDLAGTILFQSLYYDLRLLALTVEQSQPPYNGTLDSPTYLESHKANGSDIVALTGIIKPGNGSPLFEDQLLQPIQPAK